MEFATAWTILFHRSITLVVFLTLYLTLFRRDGVLPAIRKAGMNSVIAGFALSFGFTCWVFAVVSITVANAMFLLSTSAFIAAILGRFFLGEIVARATWFFLAFATLGVGVMVFEGIAYGTLFGTIMGLCAATSFASYAVLLRKGKNTDLVPSVFWAGFFTVIWSGLALWVGGGEFNVSLNDWLLCVFMGVFQTGFGLIVFTHGSKHLPAAEITLLSLTEIVLGPIWVWLVINEVPSALTMIGGTIVLSAIAGLSWYTIRRM